MAVGCQGSGSHPLRVYCVGPALPVPRKLLQASLPPNNHISRPEVGVGPSRLDPSSPIGQNGSQAYLQPLLAKERGLGQRFPLLSTGILPLEGRWWVGCWVRNQLSCQALLGSVLFSFCIFLTRDIILSKQVSHYAFLTEAQWMNASVQIPRETQMHGWDKARK